MSNEALAIALNHSRAKGVAKLVLIGIANHDGDGGSWPGLQTLARYGACTPDNARKAVRQLESLGEVRTIKNGGGTQRTADHMRPNLYEFTLKCPPDCDRTKNHRTKRDAFQTSFELVDNSQMGDSPSAEWGTASGLGDSQPSRRGTADGRGEPPNNHQSSELPQATTDRASDRQASPDLHRNALASQCRLSPRKRHHYEASGYCTFCGEHRDDHYPKFAAAVNRATGEITDDQAAAF